MKYQIVYPTGYNTSACYLIGHKADGTPIYRYSRTTPAKPSSPASRALLASILGTFLG